MGKIIGIDFGMARMGVAISDENKIVALPLTTVKGGKKMEECIKNMLNAIKPRLKECEKIIIGLPLLLSGKEGEMAQNVRKFGELLQKEVEIPIEFLDERLSTAYVDKLFKEQMNRKKRAEVIDVYSAVAILQNYIDLKRNSFQS